MSNDIEWYIIQENEHLGPFSEGDLSEQLENGDITEDVIIWKEGWDGGKSYRETFQKVEDSQFIPLEKSSEVVGIDNDEPPALPVRPSEENVSPPPFEAVQMVSNESFEEDDDESPPPLPHEFTVAPSEKIKSKNWKWKILGFFIIIGLFCVQHFVRLQDDFVRPEGMGIKEYKRLLATAKSESENAKFAFSLSKDKKRIWISTNLELEGEIQFNFSNQDQEMLGNGPIEIQGSAELRNHLIVIEDFRFRQGAKFLDGMYQVDLFTNSDLSIPLYRKFLGEKDRQFEHHSTELISNLSQRDFERMLEAKNVVKEKNETEFFETLIEEYRTVQTITNQILAGFKSIFYSGDVNREEALAKFEQDYKQNFGVFFTSFVISIDKKYELINQKDFTDKKEVIAHYAKLKKLALTIGEESIKQLEILKASELMALDADKLRELEFKSTLKYKEIILECRQMIEALAKKSN